MECAIRKPNPRHTALLHEDFGDIGVEMDGSAQFPEKPAHGLHNRSRPPDRIVDPPLALQVVDHGVDGGSVKRVAADEQRVEGEDLPQKVVLDELGNIAIDALVRLHLDEIGRDLEHVGEVEERFVGQLDKALLEDGARAVHELLISLRVCWIPLRDLAEDERLVAVVIKAASLVIEDAIERITRHELKIVFTAPARAGPELVEHEWRGDDGGASIEAEAVDLIDIRSATKLIAPLEDLDLMPARGKPDGRRQSTKATANDDNA